MQDGLTKRQLRVLKLTGDGWSAKEIGDTMNISRKGVDWHRAKICQMINLKRGMADLIRVAIGFGLTALCLMLACAATAAPIFLTPSNPVPVVQLAWNASTAPGVSNYTVYFGVGSQQYTNSTPVTNQTNASITLPARGVTYYFAVTCTDNRGLESAFSNEVNYTPPAPPAPPNLKPLVVLVVQNAPSPQGPFIDAGMNWSVSPDGPQMFYRLALAKGMILATTALPPIPR